MFTHLPARTGVLAIACTLLYYTYNRTFANHTHHSPSPPNPNLSEYAQELHDLRHDLHDLRSKMSHVEQALASSTCSHSLISSVRTFVSYCTSLSASFLLYSLFLYLFHVCVFHTSTTQTMKLLYIVNIISYSFVTIVYTSMERVHYSNLAWLLFVLLLVRLCIR